MTDTILPCPFCGAVPQLVRLGTGDGFAYGYHCPNTDCLATNGKFDTQADAIAAWNRRAPQPAPAAVPSDVLEAIHALLVAWRYQHGETISHNIVAAWLAPLRGQRPEQA